MCVCTLLVVMQAEIRDAQDSVALAHPPTPLAALHDSPGRARYDRRDDRHMADRCFANPRQAALHSAAAVAPDTLCAQWLLADTAHWRTVFDAAAAATVPQLHVRPQRIAVRSTTATVRGFISFHIVIKTETEG